MDECKIPLDVRKKINKIMSDFCSKHRKPSELPKLWKKVEELGVSVPLIGGYPHTISDAGDKGWTLGYEYNGKHVTNSFFCYSVYEIENTEENEYNIYLS